MQTLQAMAQTGRRLRTNCSEVAQEPADPARSAPLGRLPEPVPPETRRCRRALAMRAGSALFLPEKDQAADAENQVWSPGC